MNFAKRLPVALFLTCLSGCGGCGEVNTNSSVMLEGRQTEENHRRLATVLPPPQFDYSLERENLIKKLKMMNRQNNLLYIYCMGLNGNVVYHGMVKGKVSSLNSLLTTPEQIVAYKTVNGSLNYQRMPSPDFDGSYGTNPQGIFWFDPAGGYHEWSGTYYVSDRPERVNTPISITAIQDLEKKGK